MIAELSNNQYKGLTEKEAEERLKQFGANQVTQSVRHPVFAFLLKFWGPVPWMLEITLALQFLLDRYTDAIVIVVLLIVNALISFAFERRAQQSLALLQGRLQVQARVLRDGEWGQIGAEQLVPGDFVRLRAGDILPADVRLVDGALSVDQSSLTGESDLVERTLADMAYAGSIVRRGEAVAEIEATGAATTYSHTARLVQDARPADPGDAFVRKIVTWLLAFTGVLVIAILIDALVAHMGAADALLFALALLIAAIPVSLPVTYTLASALGASKLARNNVLAARLAAVREAAGMDVLCTDKTGTITQNALTVIDTIPFNGFTKARVLRLAALASDEAAQDPIDEAILRAAEDAKPRYRNAQRLSFTPFDPSTKRTESLIRRRSKGKKNLRVIKGAPLAVARLAEGDLNLVPEIERFSAQGCRSIAVAAGKPGKALKIIGLIALQDEPHQDAAGVVDHLHTLGVRVIMVTGDDLQTALGVAGQVGIVGPACSVETMREDIENAAFKYDVFARVYPEDKHHLIETLQNAGHVVGMTGDGINDAPALRQAEVGIAMSNAADITKAAASLILTAPGLKSMLNAVEVGRAIFQRIVTYTLNKVIKTFHVGLFLTLGLIALGSLLISPLHILMMVLANDLVSMSLTTDRVRPSQLPNRWASRPIVLTGLVLAIGWLLYSIVVFVYGYEILHLDPVHMDTFLFLMLVFVAICNVYLVRESRHFWQSSPGKWLVVASLIDLALVIGLAASGVLMTALDIGLIVGLLLATICFMPLMDIAKVRLFRRLTAEMTAQPAAPPTATA